MHGLGLFGLYSRFIAVIQGLKEIQFPFPGKDPQPIHGGFADGPRWEVYYPLQTDTIRRVDQQAQVGQDVFDLLAVIKFRAAHQVVGDVAPPQHVLQGPALGIGAK